MIVGLGSVEEIDETRISKKENIKDVDISKKFMIIELETGSKKCFDLIFPYRTRDTQVNIIKKII